MTDRESDTSRVPPQERRRMPAVPLLSYGLGVGVIAALVLWRGAGNIGDVLQAGGASLGWLVPWFLVCQACDTMGWGALLPRHRRRFGQLYYATWVGSAVNWLLPVAQVGGDLLRIHLLSRTGELPVVTATVVVDKTLQAATIVLFGLLGFVALSLAVGKVPNSGGVLLASTLIGLGVFVFYRLQHRGLFAGVLVRSGIVARLKLERAHATATEIDAALRQCYGRRPALIRAVLLRVLHRLLMTGEVWLGLYFLGYPVTLFDSFVIQSLSQAVRSAAFLVPGAIGVQEGGIVLLAMVLGIDADVGLGLAIAKRARELLVGLPALLHWQLTTTSRWWQVRAG
jgi:putative membrane protein